MPRRSKELKGNPSRRRALVATAIAAILFLAGIAAWRWSLTRQVATSRQPLDVILITIDTLRADALGSYGNRRASTPAIDRLALAGVRFADAHAHNVTTLPSHANILSGRYPTDHGVRDNAGFRFPQNIETLATLLHAHGYRTGAFVSAFPVDSRFGLGRGFDVYDDSFVDAQTRPSFLEQERAGTRTVALARQWIQGVSPYFCWVHIYEPHFPYAAPEPFAAQFRDDPYLGEVAAADAALAPLIDPIVSEGRRGHTLVVLTGDHGESLGEHGEATHGIFAYEATLRVPLIVFQPQRFAPRVVSNPARHVDVMPTILNTLSIPVPDGLAGRTLVPVLVRARDNRRVAAPAEPTYFEALSGTLNRGWAPLRGVVQDRLKFIELPIPELYDLDRDPGESHNLADAQPQQVERMRALVAAFPPNDPRSNRRVESAEARERLRSLGYTIGAPAPSSGRYTEADDPKRLIGLDALLQDVARLYLAGDLRGALARCRELVDRRPTMGVSLIELAHLERQSGNVTQAIDALRKAVALNPGDLQAVSLLGGYLTQAGRAREAVSVLEPYVSRGEPDLQVVISGALALAAAGRDADAIALLARVRALYPRSAMLLVETGTIHVMAGDRDRAQQDFDAALALNPNFGRAHSSLAVLAAERGRVDESLARWRQAIALDPQEAGNLLAFADVIRRRSGNAATRPYLELFVASADPARYARDIDQVRRWLRR